MSNKNKQQSATSASKERRIALQNREFGKFLITFEALYYEASQRRRRSQMERELRHRRKATTGKRG